MKNITSFKILIYLFAGLFIIQSSVFLEHYELKGIGFGKNRTKIEQTGISHGSKPIIQINLNHRFYQNETDENSKFLFLASLTSTALTLLKKQSGSERETYSFIPPSSNTPHFVLRI